MRRVPLLPAAMCLLGASQPLASDGKPKVAIVASASEQGLTACQFIDVQAKLVATGPFDTGAAVPSLATLLEYETCEALGQHDGRLRGRPARS